MLKQYNRFFLTCQVLLDMSLVAFSWLCARVMAENGMFFDSMSEHGRLDLRILQSPFILATLGLIFSFYQAGLYNSFRSSVFFSDIRSVVRGLLYFMFPAWCLTTLNPEWSLSWRFALLFLLATLVSMSLCRMIERFILQRLRAIGYNQRHILVVGTGRHAQELVHKINKCRWMGFKIAGFISDDKELQGQLIYGARVIGTIADMAAIVRNQGIDQVYCALPFDQMGKAMEVSNMLSKTTTDFRIVPDLVSLTTLNTSLFEIDGMPVLGIRESPLQGFGIVQKRVFDILFSLLAIASTGPLMLLLALLVKLTSRGPVLYRQQRLSYDGREFTILKFRSMSSDAESASGPVWATRGDRRTTWLGAIMRKTSLDELPQFFNVLMGTMSVVGPRPERPEFIKDFTEEIPRYMLRHKTKAGITGWAQVNGWRGDTSLKKRVQYDLYYLENWSIWFDLKIVIDTVVRGFVNKNAY